MMRHSKARIAVAAAIIAAATGLIVWSVSRIRTSDVPRDNTYHEDYDFQYLFEKPSINTLPDIQTVGRNVYFIHNDYIYFANLDEQVVRPLCSRTSCLHDQETDPDRMDECNAYAKEDDPEQSVGIAAYGGAIYRIQHIFDSTGLVYMSRLWKIAQDGSTKDLVRTWKQTSIDNWMIHRGYLYYEEAYSENDAEKVTQHYTLKRMALNGAKKDEIILKDDQDSDETFSGFYNLQAFGNYVYFVSLYADPGSKVYERCYVYNLKSKRLRVMETDDGDPEYVCGFWKGRLVYSAGKYSDNLTADDTEEILNIQKSLYIADLDGTNPQKLLGPIEGTRAIYFDQDHIFRSNVLRVNILKADESPEFVMMDADQNEILSCTLPFDPGMSEPAPGNELGMFYVDQKSSAARLYWWDKKTVNKDGKADFRALVYHPLGAQQTDSHS